MKVGDKVWVFLLSNWQKGVVVGVGNVPKKLALPEPVGNVGEGGAVFVWVECVREVFCYQKEFVKGRND